MQTQGGELPSKQFDTIAATVGEAKQQPQPEAKGNLPAARRAEWAEPENSAQQRRRASWAAATPRAAAGRAGSAGRGLYGEERPLIVGRRDEGPDRTFYWSFSGRTAFADQP